MTVITFKNGGRIEVEDDALAVTTKYNEADYANCAELMRWMDSSGEEKFPQPRNQFKVTERGTCNEIFIHPEQIDKITVEENEKFPPSDTGNTRVTLVDGREIEVEEDFDTANVRWNEAFMETNYNISVLSLREKDTGNRLSILARNIEMLEEL